MFIAWYEIPFLLLYDELYLLLFRVIFLSNGIGSLIVDEKEYKIAIHSVSLSSTISNAQYKSKSNYTEKYIPTDLQTFILTLGLQVVLRDMIT
jgi:hypothetical protein